MTSRQYDLVRSQGDRGLARAGRLALRGLAVVWSLVPSRFSIVFCAVGLLLGTLIGAMVAILPTELLSIPGVVIALVVALIPLTLPEMRRVPLRAARLLFFAFVAVELTLPIYLAVTAPGLPFISIIRILYAGMALTFIFCVAGSTEVRQRIKAAMAAEKPICYALLALFITFALCLPTSLTPVDSTKALVNDALNWWLPFFAAIFVLDSEERQETFFRLFIYCAMFAVALSCVEYIKQERLFLRLVPDSVLERDPIFSAAMAKQVFRDGRYRASAHFNVPLSFSEYCSLIFPIALYFTVYGRSFRDRLLGACGIVTTLVGVLASNSRGGVVGIIAASSIFLVVYSFNAIFRKKGSLVGPVLVVLVPMALSVVPAMMAAFPRVHKMVLGGVEAQNSTDDRSLEWQMAWPRIESRPITGYGLGNSGQIVGYVKSGGGFTVDSYPLTLITETGVLGLAAFYALIAIVLWRCTMAYMRNPNPHSAKAYALVAAFVAFTIERLALSQTENFANVFMLLGLFVALQQQLRTAAPAKLAIEPERSLEPTDPSRPVGTVL